MSHAPPARLAPLLIVSALGYFVDVYDLIIFSVIRTDSLVGIGVPAADTLAVGLRLLNLQMVGLLIGGPLWGVLGDRLGRRSVLFGSIFLYSIANLANAGISAMWQYEVLRVVAGVGLAGELGAGVTLVSEVMPPEKRGYGTMIISSFGLLGAIVASQAGQHLGWRATYLLGGVMGFALLLLRIGVAESPLYAKTGAVTGPRGDLFALLTTRDKLRRLLQCVGAGLPSYFVIGLVITAAPEIGEALGLSPAPVAGVAVLVGYVGMALGGMASGLASQWLASRRRAIALFHVWTALGLGYYLWVPPLSLAEYYGRCGWLGFGIGVWTLVVTNAAEQFGTNFRATAASVVPNALRGALIPIAWAFQALRGTAGLVGAMAIVGAACLAIALLATWRMPETFGRDLDFSE